MISEQVLLAFPLRGPAPVFGSRSWSSCQVACQPTCQISYLFQMIICKIFYLLWITYCYLKSSFFFKVDEIFLTSSGFWLKVMVILPARIVTRGRATDLLIGTQIAGKIVPNMCLFQTWGQKTHRLCAFFGSGAVQGREVKFSKFMQKLYKHQEFLTWLLSLRQL